MKLGPKQLEVLCGLARPTALVVMPDKITRSLERRGLLKAEHEDGSFAGITPAGLRHLADELESGRIRALWPLDPRLKEQRS